MLKLFFLVASNIFFLINIENNVLFLFLMSLLHAFFFFFLHFNYLYFVYNFKIQEFFLIIFFGLIFPSWLIFLIKILAFCLFCYFQQSELLWNYYINLVILFSILFFCYFMYLFFVKKQHFKMN